MNFRYALIWHSKYGTEEVDSFDTQEEAALMQVEYSMALKIGRVTVKKVRS